ncbi:hypothetical protein [Streptomyces sp. NPDC005780]|uniref:hypothetical protein n=1 Tax=Streptomyces sp. NPDC005780 TaxID=3364730 RepID=UPI0036816606
MTATYFAKENRKMISGAVLVDANLPPLLTDAQFARLVAFSQPQVDAAKKDPDKPQNRQGQRGSSHDVPKDSPASRSRRSRAWSPRSTDLAP